MLRFAATWICALAVTSAACVLSAGCAPSKSGSGGGNTGGGAANSGGPFGGGGAWLHTTSGGEFLEIDTPRQRSIGAAGFLNLQTIGLTTGSRYLISLYRLESDFRLAVTKDGETVEGCLIADNSQRSGAAALDCTTDAAYEQILFEVVGPPSAPFTVVLTQAPGSGAGSNEGSIATPTSLTAGVPRIGQIGGGGASYYSITGLSGEVAFNLAGTSNAAADADLELFSDSGYSAPIACGPASQIGLFGTSPESCILSAAPSSVFVKISELNAISTQFVLIADPLDPGSSAGNKNYPDVTAEVISLNTPVDGTVGLHEFKNYVFNVTAGVKHTVSLIGISSDGDADLYVNFFSGSGSNCLPGQTELGGSAAENCVVLSGGYPNYIGVYGYKATPSYTLLVSLSLTPGAGGVNQGSLSSPIIVQRNVPYTGQTGAGSSYYSAAGLGGRVTVSLMDFTSQSGVLLTPANVDLEVFADTSYQPALKCDSASTFAAVGYTESCVLPDSPGTLYIRTKGKDDGSEYVLLVH